MAPRILNLGSGLGWSVSRPNRFNPGAKNSRRPLNKMLLGPQSRSGHFDMEKNLLSLSRLDGCVEMATW